MKLLFAAQNGQSSYPWFKDKLVKSPLIDLAYCVLGTGGGPKTLLGGHWASGEGLVHLRHETLDCPTFITSWVAGPLFCPAPPSCWFDPYAHDRPTRSRLPASLNVSGETAVWSNRANPDTGSRDNSDQAVARPGSPALGQSLTGPKLWQHETASW